MDIRDKNFLNCGGRNKKASTQKKKEMEMKKAVCLVLAFLVLFLAISLPRRGGVKIW